MRFIFCLVLTALLITNGGFLYAQGSDPAETVMDFFSASKAGDIDTMKRLISGPFYNSRRVLLEHNTRYPEFLTKHYDGNIIKVLDTIIGDENVVKKSHPKLLQRYYSRPHEWTSSDTIRNSRVIAVVVVKRISPHGSNFVMKLLLKMDSHATWKIVDEILTD